MYTEKPWSLYEYLVISLTNAIVEITNARLQRRIKIVRRLEEAETQQMALTLFFFAVARIEDGTYKKRECVCKLEKNGMVLHTAPCHYEEHGGQKLL